MQYKIKTSKELEGKIKISGSKNAALPILAACILLEGKVRLNNVPRIGDVFVFLDILKTLGVKYTFEGNTIFLDTSKISTKNLDLNLIKKIRASILLLSPLLYYFSNIEIPFPGGCVIGKRPIDDHLNGLSLLGYKSVEKGEKIKIFGKIQSGNKILSANFSVTSTENLIVANVLRDGTTKIELSAIEPHVINLIDFLRKAGAIIKIKYSHTIIIEGVKSLKSDFEFDIISDYIESGTFMIMGALASKQYLDIENARIKDLYSFISKLKEAGVELKEMKNDTIRVYRTKKLKSVNIQTNIFPGFPTDIGSPFAVLMSQAKGVSRINEILFEGRLNFLLELDRMGLHTAVLNPHEALIFGKMKLLGTNVTSWDLRAGAAMVIAGLIAKGETIVTEIEYIERGYENFIGKLKSINANIEKIN